MKVQPLMSVKLLSKANPGELIRVNWNKPALAIVASMEGKNALVFLNPIDGGDNSPSFLIPQADKPVISYGSKFEIDISQEQDHIDLDNTKFYNREGSIHVSQAGQHLLVVRSCLGTTIYGNRHFDLNKSMHVNFDTKELGVSFGKWDLLLPLQDGDQAARMKLFSFELPKR